MKKTDANICRKGSPALKKLSHRPRNVLINRSVAGNIILFLFLALVGAFTALPLVYQILTAFKPLDELFLYPPRFYISRPTLKNFTDMSSVLGDSYVPFVRYVFNSVITTVIASVGHLAVSAMVAYPLAKHYHVKYRGAIFSVIFYSLMFSTYVLGIPRFLVMSKMHMLDSYWALILPSMASTLGVYLLKCFMDQLSDSILEAARIDGAGEFRILWTVVMPSIKPAWLTLIMLLVKDLWNDTNSPTLYVFNDSIKTLPVLMNYITTSGNVRAGVGAAFSLIMLAPPVIIFVLSQSKVIETMKSAGVKE